MACLWHLAAVTVHSKALSSASPVRETQVSRRRDFDEWTPDSDDDAGEPWDDFETSPAAPDDFDLELEDEPDPEPGDFWGEVDDDEN